MSGSSPPGKGSLGRALVVGSAGGRAPLLEALGRLGYQPAEADEPYGAMVELCRRPLAYRALVLSLSGVYREELQLIAAVKRRFSHMEIWLAQVDGKAAALAEGMRLGADGILAEEGVHRFTAKKEEKNNPGGATAAPTAVTPAAKAPAAHPQRPDRANPAGGQVISQMRKEKTFVDAPAAGEAILTAEELRALLQDTPTRPAANE